MDFFSQIKIFMTMSVKIDQIIDLMRKFTTNSDESELGEQESSGGGSGGGSKPPYPTVTKWATGLKRGKANPLMSKDEKPWETGLVRGKSNTLL
jgi:hypothetical protein